MRQTLLSIIMLLAVLAGGAQRTTQDMTYGRHNRKNLIISRPDEAESKPVVVWFQTHASMTRSQL